MTENDKKRLQALQAAELHDVIHESPIKIEVVHSSDKNDPIDYTHLRANKRTLMIVKDRRSGGWYLYSLQDSIKTLKDIDTQIALLQQAAQIMQNGGA